MIRKIPLARLVPGMYVVSLHRPWFAHTFWRSSFPVKDEAMVRRMEEEGITEVSIDTLRGLDIPHIPPTLTPVASHYVPRSLRLMAKPTTVSLGEERRRAAMLLREANGVLAQLMAAARLGQQLEVGRLEPIAERMIESVLRNPDALPPLARLKTQGSYAVEHGVATAALMIAFARQQGLERGEVESLALGTLVKDVGYGALDASLVGKPGRFSGDERAAMQRHVEEGLAVLGAGSRLPETAVAVVLEHHERYDGTGYPFRVVGEEISAAGRMAAIVDRFDAMTSERSYRSALSPVAALGQVFNEGGRGFDPELVAGFVHSIGIYPVGSLVRLESGHLAVVEEEHPEALLSPVVRVIYHTGRRQYVEPVVVDLSAAYGNHYGQIVRAEEFSAWGLNPLSWQPA